MDFKINCSYKNCKELGQRFILANVLPKDTLLTYGVRFFIVNTSFKIELEAYKN